MIVTHATTPAAHRLAASLLTGILLTGALSAQWTAEFPLDQTTGTTAVDASPAANNGTLISFGATPWTAGVAGNALDFAAGVDDYIELPATSADFPLYDGRGSAYSIAYWIRAANVGATQGQNVYTESSANTGGNRALFMLHGGGASGDRVRLLIRTSTPNNVIIAESTNPVYDGTWHHVVVTEASGEIRFYVDGMLDSTHFYIAGREPGTPGFTVFNFDRYSIGAVVRPTGIIDELAGTLDDFRLYDYQLSAADVMQVMAGAPLLPTRSSVAEYGVGCTTSALELLVSGSAALGGAGINLQLQNGSPNTLAYLVFGPGQVGLQSLAALGFPDCTAYSFAFTDTDLLGFLGASGVAPPRTITAPSAPSLLSAQFVVQGATIDPLNLAVDVSNAGILLLGL